MSISTFEIRIILSAALVLFGLASYLPIVKLHGAYPLTIMWSASLFKVDLRAFSGIAAAIVFWISSGQALRDGSRPSYLALASLVVTVLSVAYFGLKWNEGLSHQGYAHTLFWAAVNGLAVLCLAISITFSWSRPGGILHLLAHFMLIAWLTFVAFPFLGEPPSPLTR